MNNTGSDADTSIPEFLKRKEVPMSTEVQAPAKSKGKGKPAKALPVKGGKPAKAAKPDKPTHDDKVDAYGFRQGTMKSKAAAMYAAKSGATLEEVKKATGSVQLNVLTDLEKRGFTVKREKEAGAGKRQVTRYFLSGK